jgi:ATP:cob(I)alamin adenosyltransferase
MNSKNDTMYRSKYEAYPFLPDAPDDLRCDFEILTDEIASMTGLLRSFTQNKELKEELLFICNIIYNINPSLRTGVTVTKEELARLESIVEDLENRAGEQSSQFVLPVGCRSASLAHVLRSRCKAAVRLLYRYNQQGHAVENILYDFTNLLSGYFFLLAIKLNSLDGEEEVQFISRNYQI